MAKRTAIHELVHSRKAPKPVGAYAQAVKVAAAGESLYVSGQIPIEMPSGNVFLGDIKKQAEIAFSNLRNVIIDAKFSMDEVVKCTIYLTDMENFSVIDEQFAKLFVGHHKPARAAVQVAALPKGVGVEVDAIAIKAAADTSKIFEDDEF